MSVLRGCIDRRSVGVCAGALSWQASVRASGELLREAGAVEARYIESMIRTTEELGPYAVVAPGVAIPHARPEDGARRMALSVLTLETAVAFGSRENDPVRVVFGFSTTDGDEHIELLGELADFIENSCNTDALLDAADAEEVIAVFDAWAEKRDEE